MGPRRFVCAAALITLVAAAVALLLIHASSQLAPPASNDCLMLYRLRSAEQPLLLYFVNSTDGNQYREEIFADGTIFETETLAGVHCPRINTGKLEPADVVVLLDEIKKQGFFELDNNYTMHEYCGGLGEDWDERRVYVRWGATVKSVSVIPHPGEWVPCPDLPAEISVIENITRLIHNYMMRANLHPVTLSSALEIEVSMVGANAINVSIVCKTNESVSLNTRLDLDPSSNPPYPQGAFLELWVKPTSGEAVVKPLTSSDLTHPISENIRLLRPGERTVWAFSLETPPAPGSMVWVELSTAGPPGSDWICGRLQSTALVL